MRHSVMAWCAVMCMLGGITAKAADQLPEKQALQRVRNAHPGVRINRENERIQQIFGVPLAFGASPQASAESFRRQYADVLGVGADELVAANGLRGAPQGQPLVFDPRTQQYKFKVFKYRQVHDGLEVYEASLQVLVRNSGNFATVLADSSVRPLGAFSVNPVLVTKAFDPATDATTGMERFSQQRKVIWVDGTQKQSVPRVAVTFVGELGQPDNGPYEKWRFVVDANTGAVLHRENLIVLQDVTGNVSGMVTQGFVAEQCAPEVLTPLPYVDVSISGGASSNADAAGDFVISNPGSSSVTVQSPMSGTFFNVVNAAGGTETLSKVVTPPGPANFVHNNANTSELVRAQVNGYANANQVRDWVLFFDPASPVISTQTNFTVRVNRNDNFCPGNAWYDGVSINFCQSDVPNYPNTSFAGVSQHEYGHHVIESGGSGQGEYGEGMADVIAMLVADNPGLGFGFFYDQCGTPLRNADNTCQYAPSSCSSCGSEIHDCGRLLSGAVWDLRKNLAANFPSTYMDILAPLALASIQVHSGTSITPSITNDFLVLDDDDGDLGNGTPHSVEITAAFQAHNLFAGPPPTNDSCSGAELACPGTPVSGSTSSATNDGSSSCGTSSSTADVWYEYTPDTSGSATFALCGGGTNYDSVLSVHTGCPGSSGNEAGCDDDGCGVGGGPSTVTASVTAGVTYYIRITGWSGSAGSYTLNVTGPACQPSGPGETCDDGILNQGEDRIDCGGPCAPCDCLSDADCNDALFCTGVESCDAFGFCQAGSDPCPGQLCDEGMAACVDCLTNADCTDGVFCNGAEMCDLGSCIAGSDPCPGQLCDEGMAACVDCLTNADCTDGLFCNGDETCDLGSCIAGSDPCPGMSCDEASDSCFVACDVADVNCDGAVDAGDLLVVRGGANWQLPTGSAADPRSDVNADGAVDAGDLLVIRGGSVWQTSTGPCVCP